jgi:hypothetical protein
MLITLTQLSLGIKSLEYYCVFTDTKWSLGTVTMSSLFV